MIATDASEKQIQRAIKHPSVTYTVTDPHLTEEDVRRVVGGDGSVDLVVCAQSLHWLDLDTFYGHVRRVLRNPGGVFAAWTYQYPSVTPAVDAVLRSFNDVISSEWAPQIQYIAEGYKTIPFPFAPVLRSEELARDDVVPIGTPGIIGGERSGGPSEGPDDGVDVGPRLPLTESLLKVEKLASSEEIRALTKEQCEILNRGAESLSAVFQGIVGSGPRFKLTTTGPFPFDCEKEATLDEYLMHLRSWSAVQKAIDSGRDVWSEHQQMLFADAWGDSRHRTVKWTLHTLIGTL